MIVLEDFCEISPVVDLKKMEYISAHATIESAEEAVEAIGHVIGDISQECIYAVYVDVSMRPICYGLIGKGTTVKCPLDIRALITNAILVNAFGILLIHNHPDIGQPVGPSEEDIQVTKDLISVLDIFNIQLVDSLIIGQSSSVPGQTAAYSICHGGEVE